MKSKPKKTTIDWQKRAMNAETAFSRSLTDRDAARAKYEAQIEDLKAQSVALFHQNENTKYELGVRDKAIESLRKNISESNEKIRGFNLLRRPDKISMLKIRDRAEYLYCVLDSTIKEIHERVCPATSAEIRRDMKRSRMIGDILLAEFVDQFPA